MTGHERIADQLQATLNRIRTGDQPITLTEDQATRQAMRLRATGLPYVWITKVMGVYHGEWFSESTWRHRCRDAGAPAKHYSNGSLRGYARGGES